MLDRISIARDIKRVIARSIAHRIVHIEIRLPNYKHWRASVEKRCKIVARITRIIDHERSAVLASIIITDKSATRQSACCSRRSGIDIGDLRSGGSNQVSIHI